ncbi:hypothetical protein QTH97_02330 [Variovorax sp. J22R24]|uniref:hypothetical protein n=1 Tax=Variovorax gracilis TaxID=3053502 RepID=UPI002574E719|nr:hypothetical protein [Variovorax sp. J22R24]MDM0103754.1 hypothetical protein [Variovorax sp. J22R24]
MLELIGGIYCGRDHFADAAGIAPVSLGAMIYMKDLPPLPTPLQQRVLGRQAWMPEDVEHWAASIKNWRADEQVRRAEQKLAKARRDRAQLEEMERESAKLKRQAEVHRSEQITMEIAHERAKGVYRTHDETIAEFNRRMAEK